MTARVRKQLERRTQAARQALEGGRTFLISVFDAYDAAKGTLSDARRVVEHIEDDDVEAPPVVQEVKR